MSSRLFSNLHTCSFFFNNFSLIFIYLEKKFFFRQETTIDSHAGTKDFSFPQWPTHWHPSLPPTHPITYKKMRRFSSHHQLALTNIFQGRTIIDSPTAPTVGKSFIFVVDFLPISQKSAPYRIQYEKIFPPPTLPPSLIASWQVKGSVSTGTFWSVSGYHQNAILHGILSTKKKRVGESSVWYLRVKWRCLTV